VRLLAAVSEFDGLIQTAILERAGNLGRELARLLARCVEVEVAVDHDGQRPDRHDEQDDRDAAAGHPMFEIRPPTLKLTPPPPDSWKSMASGAGRERSLRDERESLESFLLISIQHWTGSI